MMNCLAYALRFWKINPQYKLYYNSNHVVNLDFYSRDANYHTGFLPAEYFGYEYFSSAFKGLLSSYEEDLLKKYFNVLVDVDVSPVMRSPVK